MPGHLVSVESRADTPERAPVVPQAGVQRDRQGQFVLLVNEDGVVEERRIETGAAVDRGLTVESGLSGGELVIVRGLQRVEPGLRVEAAIIGADGEAS